MGRCDGAAPLLTHHRVVLSAPAEDGWGPPSQRSPVQPVRPEETAGMAKRPFPRPGVCVTGVSRPVTMAIPFLAADTGVTSGLWRVGRPTPGHRSLLNQRRLQCRLPGGTGQEGRVSESSGDRSQTGSAWRVLFLARVRFPLYRLYGDPSGVHAVIVPRETARNGIS